MKHLLVVIIFLSLFSLSSPVQAQSETTVYLPFIHNPWAPELTYGLFYNSELYQLTDLRFTTSSEFDFTADYQEWIIEASTEGAPWREVFRCVSDDDSPCYWNNMSESVYVLNRDIGWGASLLRVHGETGDSRSAYSNLLPLDVWWANLSWNLRLSGSDYGGALLVRITDIEVPVDPSWWTRTYIDPGGCEVTPPSGSVYDEMVNSYYLDLPPGIHQFSFTWQQTGDCVMWFGSFASDDPELLNNIQGNQIPFDRKWPHR